jgi:hypothetical protein
MFADFFWLDPISLLYDLIPEIEVEVEFEYVL